MADEKARQLAEEALNRLAADLEAGRSDALKAYLAAAGRFHKYSWGNVLLINAQRPTATRVAEFHAWHQMERSVRKGEKGIMIFAPILVKDRSQAPEVSAAKPNEAFRLSGFRTAYVFDVEQTEGRPLPEFARTAGDPKDFGDKLKAIVARQGIALEYDAGIAPAYGVSTGGRIRLLPSLSAAEEFSVLAHELAHELLHHGKDVPRLSKTVRETQAEAVAFVVCRGIGLETKTAASDYIALYNGDKNTLAESLHAIQNTSARILGELHGGERHPPAPQKTAERPGVAPETPDRSPGSAPTDPEPSIGPSPDHLDAVSMDH